MGHRPFVAAVEKSDEEFIGLCWAPRYGGQGESLITIYFKDRHQGALSISREAMDIVSGLLAVRRSFEEALITHSMAIVQYTGKRTQKEAAHRLISAIRDAFADAKVQLVHQLDIESAMAVSANASSFPMRDQVVID